MPFTKAFSKLPWPQQLLATLALSTYVLSGVYVALFAKGFDFLGIHQAAERMIAGQGMRVYQEFFTQDPASHPAMFAYTAPVALLYSPLGLLPFKWAWPIYQILLHGSLWGACGLAIKEARARQIGDAEFWMPVAMALYFPIYYSMRLGQCEMVILLLLLGAMQLHRRGHWILAGGSIAIAVCLKFFLGFLLVYFLLTRRWRLLLASVSGLAILEAASLAVIPAQIQRAFWQFAPIWTQRVQPISDNHAVSGVLLRLLTTNYYTQGIGRLDTVAHVLQWVISSAIVVVYAVRLPRLSQETFGMGFYYTLVTALLISPLTDTHHFVLLLFPFMFCGFRAGSRAAWRAFYSFFAIFVPLFVIQNVDLDRYAFFATGWRTLLFSLPFGVLLALWFYLPGNEGSPSFLTRSK